jgi:hypothetical protein
VEEEGQDFAARGLLGDAGRDAASVNAYGDAAKNGQGARTHVDARGNGEREINLPEPTRHCPGGGGLCAE